MASSYSRWLRLHPTADCSSNGEGNYPSKQARYSRNHHIVVWERVWTHHLAHASILVGAPGWHLDRWHLDPRRLGVMS